MQITVKPRAWQGEVRAIASKSYAQRRLIAAALSDTPSRILCADRSQDILVMARCLRALGAEIRDVGDAFEVTPIAEVTQGATLDCGECGTALRFLLPVAAALGANCAFTGQGRLVQRPLSPLYEVLAAHGVTLSPQGIFPLTCKGKLTGGDFSIAANISSQFVGGLMMALPLVSGACTLTLTDRIESAPYIAMTIQVLQSCHVAVEQVDARHFRFGAAGYHAPQVARVEGDWSNSAFWLVAGALKGPVTVNGLAADSRQGDRAVLEVLRRMGARITADEAGVTAYPSALQGIEIDARHIPDLVPALAVAAAGAQGRTVITHAERLRLKESDRIESVCAMLRSLGGRAEPTKDGLIVEGQGCLAGGTVDGCNDHRIVMAAAVASILAEAPVCITGAQAVEKSYPTFFEDAAALGCNVQKEA